jgi:hypothetical protein
VYFSANRINRGLTLVLVITPNVVAVEVAVPGLSNAGDGARGCVFKDVGNHMAAAVSLCVPVKRRRVLVIHRARRVTPAMAPGVRKVISKQHTNSRLIFRVAIDLAFLVAGLMMVYREYYSK